MILVLVEYDARGIDALSLQTVTLARRLGERTGAPLHAVLVGGAAHAPAEELAAYGVAVAHVVEDERLDEYAPGAWARSIVVLTEGLGAQAVLAAASERGNEVMAHVGAIAGLPVAVNCTEVEPGEPYVVTRLRWGGSLLEEARLHGAIKLLTVAPSVVEPEEAPERTVLSIETVSPELADEELRVRVAARVAPAEGQISLAEARVVVGGGRGVGSAEGFAALEELAQLLGGAVGGSRVVTNLGWRPHADQIGQTGARIAPDLYIACGVSGAIQHMVGCKGAKRLLAINSDPNAPVVSKADYAVLGDLAEIVPAISAEIRRRKQ